MYTLKFCRSPKTLPENVMNEYSAVACKHFNVTFLADDAVIVTLYQDMTEQDGVEYRLGVGQRFCLAYVENIHGETIDKIHPLS